LGLIIGRNNHEMAVMGKLEMEGKSGEGEFVLPCEMIWLVGLGQGNFNIQ